MRSSSGDKKKATVNKKNSIKSAPQALPQPEEVVTSFSNSFPVVGVGASAGGLDAFKKLLSSIPEDSGMAFVLVQHLHPGHESMLPGILQRITRLPVLEISDDIKVLPNHIYIIPSNKMLLANDGVLKLSPRSSKKSEPNLPIDIFFSSLAEVYQAHSIGVILSGTASDGTLGVKAIKEQGGITFAQEESSAAYEGMPHSAIQSGMVDFILPPEKIIPKIIELTRITHGNGNAEEHIPEYQGTVFKQMLALLRIRKGIDFTYYKPTTIHRRILRRMAINKTDDSASYLKFLKENKPEQDILFQDLLIPVTSFFRDPKTFENLFSDIFPKLLKDRNNDPLRIWVAGCSTGEEVYSIAICLREYLLDPDNNRDFKGSGIKKLSDVSFQIFATDVNESAIAKARTGLYSKADVLLLSEERLGNFFIKSNGNYQLHKSIRENCVFARHNYLKDPPFGKIDLISCRNSLIYMEPYLQKKALTTFHYALNPKGYLLLGKSETISSVPELFTAAVKHDKLFIRKDHPGKFIPSLSRTREHDINSAAPTGSIPVSRAGHLSTDFQNAADEIMLRKYTPAGVVVNEAMDIVHFRGNTSNYLQQAPGKPSHNLLKMAKNGLGFELRNLLHKAKKERGSAIRDNIPVFTGTVTLNISIEAILLPNMQDPHYLVLFHDRPGQTYPVSQLTGKRKSAAVIGQSAELRIEQLERELAQAREDMRSITEDQEAANEELQSANEELVSGTEELQSMNEELETGKEELQSTNEELTVMNHELISMNEQATEAREFSQAVISNLHEPLLVLDKNLRIKIANIAFYKTFLVNEAETEGKVIYELGNDQWNIPALRQLLEQILPERSRFDRFEVTHRFPTIGERTMLLNAREMRTESQGEKLILLAIEDITERFKGEQNLTLLATIVESSNDAIISKTVDGIISTWNKGAEKIFGYTAQEAIGKHINMLIPQELMEEEEMIIRKIKQGESIQLFETIRLAKNGARLNVSLTVSPILDKAGKITGASKIARDITGQDMLKKLKESEAFNRSILENSPDCVKLIDVEGRIQYMNTNGLCIMEADNFSQFKNKPWAELWNDDNRDLVLSSIDKAMHGKTVQFQAFCATAKGTEKWWDVLVSPVVQPGTQKVTNIISVSRDITSQRKIQSLLEYRKALLEAHNEASIDGILLVDAKGKILSYNKQFLQIWNMPQHIVDTKDDEAALVFAMTQLVNPEAFMEKVKWLYQHPTESCVDILDFKDGKIVERHGYPVIGEDQAYYAWSWTFRDITEQKRSQLALQESETLYHNLIYSSPSGICVLSGPDLKIKKANDEIIRIWGKGNDVLGKPYFEFMPELVKQGYPEIFNKVYSTGTAASFVETPVHVVQNGIDTLNYYNFILYPQRNADSEVEGIGIIATEVTQQAEYNKKLQESETHFRQLANLIPDKIMTADASGVINYYNQNWVDFTGRRFSELITSGWAGFIHPDEQEEVATKWHTAIKSGEDLELELRMLDKHGTYKWHLTRNSAVKDEEGKVIKWIGCMTEIQKIKEEEKRKDDFLKMVSHELKTPVTSIKGYVQLLLQIIKEKQETPSAFIETPLLRIDNQIGRLGRLISEMLDLSRLDTGNLQLNKELFDLDELVKETIQDISFTNHSHHIQFTEIVKVPILGDRSRIGQVIINLLNNAIKYSPENTNINVSMLLHSDGKVAVTVTDQGIGIDQEHQEKIFDRFYRAGGESEKNYSGFGIGLFIAAQIITRHDGNIFVKSIKDKGAAFTFLLPVAGNPQ